VGSRSALYARAAQHRTVGSPGTVAVSLVWATGRCCTVAALQPPLSTRLAGAWCLLVVRRFRRYAHSPKGDHDDHARGISVYFNSTPTVGSSRHTWRPRSCPGLGSGSWGRRSCGDPGAAPGWAVGAGAAGHVATRSCPGPGSGSWSRRTRGDPGAAPGRAAGAGATGHVATRSCPGPGSGSWSRRTRGDPGAAPGWAAGAGAKGHAATPELPRAVRFMLRLITRGSA
jgi:hypothetical protein